MLAIEFTQHKEYYHKYGLVAKKIEQKHEMKYLEFLRKDILQGKEVCLSLRAQHTIHSYLRKIINKHEGVIRNPELFARQLKSGVYYKPPQIQTQKKKNRKNEAAEEEVDQDVQLELLNFQGILASSRVEGQNVSIYYIDDETYRAKVPNYINQLSPYFEKKLLRLGENLILAESNMLNVFKEIRIVTDVNMRQMANRYNSNTQVIINRTSLTNRELIRKCNFKEVVTTLCTEVIYNFPGLKRKSSVYLMGDANKWKDVIKVGSTMIENFKTLLRYGHIEDDLSTISKNSECIGIKSAHNFSLNHTAIGVINKFISQCEDETQLTVNLVVIGKKGCGKSSFFREYMNLLSTRFESVGHLSSDAYGRWYYNKFGDQDPSELEKISHISYNEVLEQDNDETLSIYEHYAMTELYKAKVLKRKQWLRKNVEDRRQMRLDFITKFYYNHLKTGNGVNEALFYELIRESKDCPRIMIIEGHSVSQDPVLAKTDTTLLLETFVDCYTSIVERERKSTFKIFEELSDEARQELYVVGQIFLYESYCDILSTVHPVVYPSDFLWVGV